MCNKRQSGATLVELIVAMVIIGIAVAGVLQVFNVTAVASADPIVQKQLRVVAEGMMDEIQRQPFAASANDAPSTNCARNTFNDVLDYNGYAPGKICLVDGEDVAALAGMTITVSVATTAGLAGVPQANAYFITVTTARSGNTFTLRGWRTNYADGVAE